MAKTTTMSKQISFRWNIISKAMSLTTEDKNISNIVNDLLELQLKNFNLKNFIEKSKIKSNDGKSLSKQITFKWAIIFEVMKLVKPNENISEVVNDLLELQFEAIEKELEKK